MQRPRGITLLEVCAAFAVFAVAVVTAFALAAQAHRHQRALWEELAAREYAQSLVERALAADDLAPTPEEGEAVAADAGAPDLAALHATRFVTDGTKVPGAPAVIATHLRCVRAEVAWRPVELDGGAVRSVRAERLTRRPAP